MRRRYEALGNSIKSNPYVSERKYFNLDQIALDTKFTETAERLTLIKEHELRLEGQISTHLDQDSVAEYEEELELARNQVQKLEALDEIFKKTSDYLAQASRKMHREIAPKIERELCSKASIVTKGKYDNFQINSDDLTVMVKIEGSYHKVSSLSHGTQEQIYLILRLALIDYLNNTGEPCPVFLDDITVHSDLQRKKDILDLIHEVSKTRQIILFRKKNMLKNGAP